MKIINSILVIAVIILLITNIRSCYKANKIEKDFSIENQKDLKVKKAIEKEATIISRNVDKFGSEHVTIDAKEKLFPSSVFDSPVAVSAGILDTTAMALNIQKKQIIDLTVVISTIKAQKLKAQYQLDSLKNEIFTYSDNYVNLKFTPGDTATNVIPTFDFQYNNKLTTVQYYKRNFPIIGAKKSYIDIYSNDPRATINGVNKFTVEQKSPNFGLRLQLRAMYGLDSKKMYLGPGVSFDVGRFNVLGYAYYNYTDKIWLKSIGLNYDLIRF